MMWHRFVMKKFQALAQLMEKVIKLSYNYCTLKVQHLESTKGSANIFSSPELKK
jgi:hypothetical protein